MFHHWGVKSDVVLLSLMQNGQQNKVFTKETVAVVEYEDGTVDNVPANMIVFNDSKKIMIGMAKRNAKWKANNDITNINNELVDEEAAI